MVETSSLSNKFKLIVLATCPEDTMRGPYKTFLKDMKSVLNETASQEMIPFYDEFTFKYDRDDPCGKKEYYLVERGTGNRIPFLEIVDDRIWLKPTLFEEVGFYEVALVAYLEDYPWIRASEYFTVRVLPPLHDLRVTLSPEFSTPLTPVVIHPGEVNLLTIEA